jgi:hypothetical protein
MQVPMVGFGFMDNLVMIQAGDAIDANLGLRIIWKIQLHRLKSKK